MEEEFAALVKQWKDEYIPDMPHSAKSKIKLYGKEYIPLIMQDLKSSYFEGWLELLPGVFGRNVVPDHHIGMPALAIRDWLMWYAGIYNYSLTSNQLKPK